MKRRIVLALTAAAVLSTGAGIASASTSPHSSAPSVGDSTPLHQFCVLLYRSDPNHPQHICVNW